MAGKSVISGEIVIKKSRWPRSSLAKHRDSAKCSHCRLLI